MASDNLMAMAMTEQPPWFHRTAFSDAWISDMFSRETDALTRLVSNNCSNDDVFDIGEAFFGKPEIAPIQTPTVSGASEIDSPVPKPPPRRRSLQPSGKVTKRKSRASKRETTTYITVDQEHFRQMVQEVTGAKFDGYGGRIAVAQPVLKPEPHRAAAAAGTFHGLREVSTFDTSALILQGSSPPTALVCQFGGCDGGGGAAGFDVEAFGSFPTLESWKVE